MTVARKSLVFLAITFAISWTVSIGGHFSGLSTDANIAVGALISATGPAIAALTCAFLFEKGHRRESLGLNWTPNWWWLGAWAFMAALTLLTVGYTMVFGHRELIDIADSVIAQAEAARPGSGEAIRNVPLLGLWIILAAATLNTLVSAPVWTLTEELGWRGYLHHIWRPAGFWRASLATGAVWGLWHAPAIYLHGLNYPDSRELGVALFIVWCAALGPVMTFVRDKGRSVIAAGIAHAAINAMAGLTLVSLSNPVFPWNGVAGIGGFMALLTLVAVVALLRRRAALAPNPPAL